MIARTIHDANAAVWSQSAPNAATAANIPEQRRPGTGRVREAA
jgi:hypothetical protein